MANRIMAAPLFPTCRELGAKRWPCKHPRHGALDRMSCPCRRARTTGRPGSRPQVVVGRRHTKAFKVRETRTVVLDIVMVPKAPGDVGSARTQKVGKARWTKGTQRQRSRACTFPKRCSRRSSPK